jgi:chromosome segregation ATPase
MKKGPGSFIAIGIILTLLMVSGGCQDLEQRLEVAQQEANKLMNENQELGLKLDQLERKVELTSNEIRDLETQLSEMRTRSEDLKGTNEKLLNQNKELKESQQELKRTIAGLRDENRRLKGKLANMKATLGELGSDKGPAPQDARAPEKAEPVEGPPPPIPEEKDLESKAATPVSAKAEEEADPCAMIIKYMKTSGEAIRKFKGEAREKELEKIRNQFAAKIQAAPKAAINSAHNWVDEVSRTWDKASSDSIFGAINMRNKVLEACGMNPEEQGF